MRRSRSNGRRCLLCFLMGFNGFIVSPFAYRFSFSSHPQIPQPTGLIGHAMTTINGIAYCFGGLTSNGNALNAVYSFKNSQWTPVQIYILTKNPNISFL